MSRPSNIYSKQIQTYDSIPKSVLAAIVVLLLQEDDVNREVSDSSATDAIMLRWWELYDHGIVPQKPSVSRPAGTTLGGYR